MTRAANGQLLALVESFFHDHLQRNCGVSVHTIRAYRDTLRLLFSFLADTKRCGVADLQLGDLTVDAIAAFLVQLESRRRNTAATRNCRLTAIHSLNGVYLVTVPGRKRVGV